MSSQLPQSQPAGVAGVETVLPPRTVVPSAPAQDPISQAQIVLNNLLDQVRENFHFLLEGAPALTVSGELAQPPVRTLSRCRQDRIEFEKSWRKMAVKRLNSTSHQASDSGQSGAKIDEPDNEEDDQLVSAGAADNASAANVSPGASNEPSADAMMESRRDTLFRAQRMAAITQALRALVPQLPSTIYKDPETNQRKYIDDPHKSEEYSIRLKYWDEMNERVNEVFESHLSAFGRILEELNDNQSLIVAKILNQKSS